MIVAYRYTINIKYYNKISYLIDKYGNYWYGIYGDKNQTKMEYIVFDCTIDKASVCMEIEEFLNNKKIPYDVVTILK